MQFRFIFTVLLMLGTVASAYGDEQQSVPDNVYPDLEYILSLTQSSADLDPEQLSGLIHFVGSVPDDSGMTLKGSAGSFRGVLWFYRQR